VVTDAMSLAKKAVALDAFHNGAADNAADHTKKCEGQHLKPFEVRVVGDFKNGQRALVKVLQ
jgi:hypothetical protein